MITCHSVTMDIGTGVFRQRLINDLNCVFPPGIQLVLLGQRASGKSTLLRLLGGQLIATRGWVERRGKICPPGGLLSYASKQSSPRQFIALTSRLYDVDARDLFEFVQEFAQLGAMMDQPLSALNKALRQQLNFALTYGIPFDFYLMDGSLGRAPAPGFQQMCEDVFAQRRLNAGVIFATSNPKVALRVGGQGAIIHQGQLTLYSSLAHALDVFSLLPQPDVPVETRRRDEPAAAEEEDEAFSGFL